MEPVTEYWPVAGLQEPGVAVRAVMLQSTAQLVVPAPLVCEKERVPAWPE